MEKMVFEAALKGDVASLKRLLDDDPLVLERSMVSVYSDTPLHVAAMLGYEDFAKEILKRKPELATELNSKQSSPLHLAAAMGHAGVVRALLLVDRRMCKARDRDGLTPIHLAAVKGRLDVLKELTDDHEICSSELSEVMAMDGQQLGESILHMCVKHGQLESLKFVVEMIGDGGGDFVNSKDAFGNTVLHLAVEYKQFEAVKFLVQRTRIQVNAENGNRLTAMGLFQSRNNVKEMEIGEVLRDKHKGAKQYKNEEEDRDMQSQPSKMKKNAESWVHEMREGLMVAASLLAAMAFQAIVNPPGGVLQEDKHINPDKMDGCVFFGFISSSLEWRCKEIDVWSSNDPLINGLIGDSVMSHMRPTAYEVFAVANTLSFLASLSVILILISGLPLHRKFFMYIMMITMWVAISAASLSYFICLQMTTSLVVSYEWTFIWACLFATLAVLIGLGYIIKVTMSIKKWFSTAFNTRSNKNSSSMV